MQKVKIRYNILKFIVEHQQQCCARHNHINVQACFTGISFVSLNSKLDGKRPLVILLL